MTSYKFLTTAACLFLVACGGKTSDVIITELEPQDLPQDVRDLVMNERGDFEPQEIEKKVREGRIYYDIEGSLPDGSEIEFDVLMTDAGPSIVEIQRDRMFSQLPEEVQALSQAKTDGAIPVRIIESTQTDNSIIYEFFLEGLPSDPAYEIMVKDGEVKVLDERWQHRHDFALGSLAITLPNHLSRFIQIGITTFHVGSPFPNIVTRFLSLFLNF